VARVVHCDVGGTGGRAPRAAGTRTAWDVLRSGFRTPSPERSADDLRAVQAGEGRTVSCFLRADYGPYPRRKRQGMLEVRSPVARWRPFWSIRRPAIDLALSVTGVTVRNPDKSEWNLKKGGTFLGVVPVPRFQVVVCRTSDGTVEFAVPSTDAELVASFFSPQAK
jgi:hypothetical protein